jgi:hypothetical protein
VDCDELSLREVSLEEDVVTLVQRAAATSLDGVRRDQDPRQHPAHEGVFEHALALHFGYMYSRKTTTFPRIAADIPATAA